jgi:hypothetical protein
LKQINYFKIFLRYFPNFIGNCQKFAKMSSVLKKKFILFLVLAVLFVFSGCDLFLNNQVDSDDGLDCDGDGYSDFEEEDIYMFNSDNNPLKFNPYVADLPELELELMSLPEISIIAEKSGEETKTVETDWSTTEEQTFTSSNTSSTASTIENAAGITISAEHEFGLLGGTTISAEASYNYSNSQETSNSLTNDLSKTRSSTYETAQSLSSTSGYTLTGGKLKIYIIIRNSGDISYTVKSLGLSAVRINPQSGNIIPVANMSYDGDSFPETTLAPNSSMNAVYSANLSLSTAESLLKDYNNILIQTSNYEVVDINGKSFAHNMTAVESRTGSVLIDYGIRGNKDPERYKISPDFSTDDEVSLKSVFDDVLKLTYTEEETEINNTSVTGITSVRGHDSNSDSYPGYWILLHTFSNSGIDTTQIYSPSESYSTEDIIFNRGDKILLMYVEDLDYDGLLAREEFTYGTSDENIDSDGDGTSDYDEVQAGTNPAIAKSEGIEDPPVVVTPTLGNVSNASVSLNSSNRKNAIITWTNPNTSINTLFKNVLILRGEGTPVTGVPVSGQNYSTGDYIANSSNASEKFEIVYIGDASSFQDSNLTYGKTYTYKIFASDMIYGIGQHYSSGDECSVKTDISISVTLDKITVTDEKDGSGKCELYWTIKVITATNEYTLDERSSSDHWSTNEATLENDSFDPGVANFTIPQTDSSYFKVDIDVKEYDDATHSDKVIDSTRTFKVLDSYIVDYDISSFTIKYIYGDRYWYDSTFGWYDKTVTLSSSHSEDTEAEVVYTITASH